jgi:hypothetical protein
LSHKEFDYRVPRIDSEKLLPEEELLTWTMDSLDQALCRAHEIFLGDLSDETEDELDKLMPTLLQAGYVKRSGESSSGVFWSFTDRGVARGQELGCL